MIKNVLIEKQDNFGLGITHVDGKTVFVYKTLPGDRCDIEYVKETKNYNKARVVNYISTSIVDSKCRYYDLCGGCNILHQSYEEQLQFKENKIRELVSRNLGDVNVNKIISSNQYNYRNKIILHIKNNKLGLYEASSNDIVPIKECLLVDEKINNVIKKLSSYVEENIVRDNEVLIRCGEDILVSFKNDIDLNIIDFLMVDNIVINGKTVKGHDYVILSINDIKYKVTDKSFYQVNSQTVVKLYEEIIKGLGGKRYKKVLDLYSGVGTISLMLSKVSSSVIGIEVVEEAVKDANFNKEFNSIDNVEFIYGKVEDNIDNFSDIDAIVVDPPRAGLDKKTIDNIFRINPEKLIYTSCDPNTLVRDLAILSDKYNILAVTPVDMFPNTYHVECVSILHRKDF